MGMPDGEDAGLLNADSSSPSTSDLSWPELMDFSSDAASSDDAGAVRWVPEMDTLDPAQNPQLMVPSPLAVPAVPVAAAPPVQLLPGPLVQLPPAPPPGPQPKRHRSDAAADGAGAGSPALRHYGAPMPIETVLDFLSTKPQRLRPIHVLSDASDPQSARGCVYIEHGKPKKRPTGSDYWHGTKTNRTLVVDSGHHFEEDISGRWRACGPQHAGARGIIAFKKSDIKITLRNSEAGEEAYLDADHWHVELHYAAVTGASAPPGEPRQLHLYHILPLDQRRQTSQSAKQARGSQLRQVKTEREVGGGAPRLPAAAAGEAAAAAAAAATESIPELPPTVIIQKRPENFFLSFQSNERKELGALERNGEGVKLSSTNGDFAEYHRRVVGEPEFEEGDVVGFVDAGDDELCISRVTKGAKAFGVI